jgi:hypothetical protein
MQGIYTYIPETNHVPREYTVAAILSLLFMVSISLVPTMAILYFYVGTFRSNVKYNRTNTGTRDYYYYYYYYIIIISTGYIDGHFTLCYYYCAHCHHVTTASGIRAVQGIARFM